MSIESPSGKMPSEAFQRELESRLNTDPQSQLEELEFQMYELARKADPSRALELMGQIDEQQRLLETTASGDQV
ncbi:MAG TPA: hypothetical protein VGF75_00510 [Candidatus Saccharimonadales bacterium]|jgi:hypothetical protein